MFNACAWAFLVFSLPAESVLLQSIQGAGGSLAKRDVKLLHAGDRFAERTTEARCRSAQRRDHILFGLRGYLLLRKNLAIQTILSPQSDYKRAAERRYGARHISLASRALADFLSEFAGKRCARRLGHELERVPNLPIRNNIKERRLAECDTQPLFERTVEDGVSGGIVKVGQNNRVIRGELTNLQ